MTTAFRLNAVVLDTVEGPVRHTFPADLTILAGPTGVGKTTLLELIKYGFGGDGVLAPVVTDYVNDVTLDVIVGASHFSIVRSIDATKRRSVRVTDLRLQERLPDHSVDPAKTPNLSTLLMTALGFSDEMRAAARTGASTNTGSRITFNDIFGYLYVAQSDMNRDIANSTDNYLESKRKAVFELLFALTNAGILALRSEVNRLNGELATAELESATIRNFLRGTHTTGKEEALSAFTDATNEQIAAEARLRVLREAIDPVTDRETQVLRDLLTETERRLADVKSDITMLIRQQKEYTLERRRVQSDLARLHRMRDAGERLANIEFVHCPRCMQSLTGRVVPDGTCRVCLQPDPVPGAQDDDQYESRQLASQLEEMDDQLAAIADQFDVLNHALADREALIKKLTIDIDARTAQRVTPRLQAFTDAADALAHARSRQRELETTLRQWDRVDDLTATEDALRAERDRAKARIARFEADIKDRRKAIFDELNTEFQETIHNIGVPSIETASIHPTSYLPLLNGQVYSKVSKGGGIITATQIAYWSSLLAVAIRRGDTFYPAFLLIDSPRMALNTAETLAAALYSRLRGLAGSVPGRLQMIIADNEVPAEYRQDIAEVDFSYEHPTVTAIEHPGPAAVQTLDTRSQQ
ncbi:hypothetical protein ACI2K4_22450 [Micromonospora sp. NPDC050397]|uniref:hypothetical protein n=1 Tax=Micromonospora sp. NPDC050397 TaxID=3364279 RepID=UPI0038517063